MTLYIVVREDRHTSVEISAHSTRELADAAILEFQDRYGDAYEWSEQGYGRDVGWVRYVESDHDDGPSARIEVKELDL